MAIQTINVGNIANDGTGDDLRQAFVKVNNNFTDLDGRYVPQNDADNLGDGIGVFASKESNTLNFKSLKAGDNVSLSQTGNDITISAPAQLQVGSDANVLTLTGANRRFNVTGGTNINTTLSSNNLSVSIDANGLVQLDTSPTLGGNLDADSNNINNVNTLNATTVNATTVTGNHDGTVKGLDVEEINRQLGIDFGNFEVNAYNIATLFTALNDVDYGTITSPATLGSDLGSLV